MVVEDAHCSTFGTRSLGMLCSTLDYGTHAYIPRFWCDVRILAFVRLPFSRGARSVFGANVPKRQAVPRRWMRSDTHTLYGTIRPMLDD